MVALLINLTYAHVLFLPKGLLGAFISATTGTKSRQAPGALHIADAISLALHINFLQMTPRGQYVECTPLF
jgi:hypothetical protein